MVDFNNREDLRSFIAAEILFPNEAAKYLNITSQRLNQLVQSGKLEPVKISRSGSLYLRQDLDERLKELAIFEPTTNSSVKKDLNNMKTESVLFGNDPKIITEAINYFTLQTLHGNSMKKTKPVYEEVKNKFDVYTPFTEYAHELSTFLKIDVEIITKTYNTVYKGFNQLLPTDIVMKIGQEYYPKLLEKTEQAPPFLFMRGNLNLIKYQGVAIVGTRVPSEDGTKKATKLAAVLGKNRIVVVSGLAKGIDRAAHEGALINNNPTIAVIGTPLTKSYPRENAEIQKKISEEGLLISQFAPSSTVQRWNFPLRNSVMSGLSLATVIIEAGETSGALIQADYALKQKRLVFIPQSALDNEKLKWPRKYIQKIGAEKFSRIEDLIKKLEQSNIINLIQSTTNHEQTSSETEIRQISLFDEEG